MTSTAEPTAGSSGSLGPVLWRVAARDDTGPIVLPALRSSWAPLAKQSVVAALIVWTAIDLLVRSFNGLMDHSLPEAEQAMGTDTAAALPLLTLCLGALLALALGGVAARQRFRAGLVWVVCVPLLVATAWLTTDVAMRLLPNLL